MKISSIVAVLLIAGSIYYYTDGGKLLGLHEPKDLPETIAAPNATFMGDAEENPFLSS